MTELIYAEVILNNLVLTVLA